MRFYRLDVYVPDSHVEAVKTAIFQAGAGNFGNYDSCCWQTEGTGQFRPLEGAHPFYGEQGRVEHVKEWKLEFVVAETVLEAVLTALRESHPYETPAFQYWPVNRHWQA